MPFVPTGASWPTILARRDRWIQQVLVDERAVGIYELCPGHTVALKNTTYCESPQILAVRAGKHATHKLIKHTHLVSTR